MDDSTKVVRKWKGRAGAREILQIQEQIIVIIILKVRGGEDRGNEAWVIVQKHIKKKKKEGKRDVLK